MGGKRKEVRSLSQVESGKNKAVKWRGRPFPQPSQEKRVQKFKEGGTNKKALFEWERGQMGVWEPTFKTRG